MNFEGALLSVTRGTGLMEFKIDLSLATAAERRLPELAYVNKSTGLELNATFLAAYSDLKTWLAKIRYEYVKANKILEERKSVVLLEVAPGYLQNKGLTTKASPAGAEDFRNAVIVNDSEVKLLTDDVDKLKAAYEYLSVKADTFKMAYQQIKKIYDNNDLETEHGLRSDDEVIEGMIGRSRY